MLEQQPDGTGDRGWGRGRLNCLASSPGLECSGCGMCFPCDGVFVLCPFIVSLRHLHW